MSSSANQIVSKVGKAAAAYRYEIDCNRVSDSIDVVDLVGNYFLPLINIFLLFFVLAKISRKAIESKR